MHPRRVAPALALLPPAAVPAIAFAQTRWHSVHLTWTAPGDDSLSGTATQYDLRCSTSTGFVWLSWHFSSAAPARGLRP